VGKKWFVEPSCGMERSHVPAPTGLLISGTKRVTHLRVADVAGIFLCLILTRKAARNMFNQQWLRSPEILKSTKRVAAVAGRWSPTDGLSEDVGNVFTHRVQN
jgi:hypothetical protein